jgi:hypothetical protein
MGTTLEDKDIVAADEANGIVCVESEIICCFNVIDPLKSINMPVHSHARGHGHCNPPLTFKCRAFKNMVA